MLVATQPILRDQPKVVNNDNDLLIKMYELLQGERDLVRVYSNALNSEICFVNTDASSTETLPIDEPFYTTREIAMVLSMSDTELKRYHYLKKKLL